MAQHVLFFTLSTLSAVHISGAAHVHHGHSFQHSRNLIRGAAELGNNDVLTNLTLSRRDDHKCAPGRLSLNGACCGESGNCGYGSLYCGDGCSSNCNAAAECGQFHKVLGTTCLLDVCCSKFGFCGTTSEFCTGKCQTNCVEHPKPPAGRGQVTDRVIGYWEAWNAQYFLSQTDKLEFSNTGV